MLSTLPNQLTLFRVLVIPMLVVLFYTDWQWRFFASAALFGLAGITDALDGYYARKYNLSTPFGAFLDPVADKLIVAVALALLIEQNANAWFTLPAVVIICREIVISALREWMAELGARSAVAVSWIGKLKTTLQIIAILLLLAFPAGSPFYLHELGLVTVYGAAVLTLWSMFVYLKAAWPSLSGKSIKSEEQG
ncbi:CDP-diacylglycerol--glycerol-3-phosphate 3-phosphatidyltransferase [Agaribacterium haliotis]|uniref:CDP-diacylglycerol--glycerol-3-phosphate 3-phosphatidyltransferase n=1 Tax=Agaribacterium haliotis TaxID=2013869 RepID=UPI000BB57FB7|nr:CDP-diacylglycerol--glycerol-3-phosphate 3-phosphatidyltransferase [Agaribacterium haliotis]